MLVFAQPWLFLVLPLPLLVWKLVPPYSVARQGLVVPFLKRLAEQTGQQPQAGAVVMRGRWSRTATLVAAWICAITALARPQIIEPAITRQLPMRDMLLAVDLSGSMETRDFKDAAGKTVDRLTAVKEVLAEFLKSRKGDRVGLIFFGTAPFVQAPFTEDLNVCRELLDEAQVKMAGPQTAFGDALGLAITVFERSTMKQRVLIALTDGNDTASQMPPQEAAEIAKDRGIVIHTISVGDPQAAGEDALDVEALKQVAATTGALYAHAADRNQLNEIYRKIDALEPRQTETISHRPRREIYWWPLLAAVGIGLSAQVWLLFSAGMRAKRRKDAALRVAPISSRSTNREEVTR